MEISQNGQTSLLVTWRYSSSQSALTGFHISYIQRGGGHNGSVTAGVDETNATIEGLVAGGTYSISVVANSSTLPSHPTTQYFTLRMCSL